MKKIPTHEADCEYSHVTVTPDPVSNNRMLVTLLLDGEVYGDAVYLSPGGAVLLAERLLKVARKVTG